MQEYLTFNPPSGLTEVSRRSNMYDPTVRIVDKSNMQSSQVGSFISEDTIVTSSKISDIPIKNMIIEPSLNGNAPFGTINQIFEIVVKGDLAYIKLMNKDAGKSSGFYDLKQNISKELVSVGYAIQGQNPTNPTLYSMDVTPKHKEIGYLSYNKSPLGFGSPILNAGTNQLVGVKRDIAAGADMATSFDNNETFKYAVKMKDKKPVTSYNKQVSVKKEGYNIWQNYRWDGVRGSTTGNLGKVYNAKYIYKMENGSQYYSLYNANGSWAGYLNTDATMNVEAKSFKKNVKVTSPNYTLWNNFYFNSKKGNTKNMNGKTYEARYIYELGNGQKYYSMYDNGVWLGYLNTTGTNMK